MECWELKKRGWFADVEVIKGIFYWRNHRGIQNVSSIRWRDRFTDANADGITEGFKTAAPYGDKTDSPMQMPMESPRDSKQQLRTVTCPVYRQNHRRNIPSVNPSAKVNTSTLTRPYPPLFFLLLLLLLPLLFLPHLNCSQLQTTSPPPKKISLFSAQQVIYLEVFLSQHSCSDLPTDFYQFL